MFTAELESLREQLADLGIETEKQHKQLLDYSNLLYKWNKHFNFVSRLDIERLPRRHLLDSLSSVSLLLPGRVLDIGSGGGLPGLVLAIARPDVSFTLLDRHSRKVRFLNQCIQTLGLANVQAVEVDLQPDDPWSQQHQQHFQTILSRAVTGVQALWTMSLPLLQPGGQLVAYTSTQSSAGSQFGETATDRESEKTLRELFAFDPFAKNPQLRQLHPEKLEERVEENSGEKLGQTPSQDVHLLLRVALKELTAG
ncbi:MAG: 16S rRNA (guanine(527)-N(7))-methyltransferase RsmG [Pseudomonadota bacterium]